MPVCPAYHPIDRVHERRLPGLASGTGSHVVGAFHMHSADSHDSALSLESLAKAAHELGYDFIIVTDHNKQRARATQLEGVWVLSYAELSTAFGHCVQLGATYTLDPTLRRAPTVFEAVQAAHGTPILTHPSDLKRPWSGGLEGAGGLEVANFAAAARRAAQPLFFGLLPELVAWPLNPRLALAQLYDRDDAALASWDSRPEPTFVGLCGSDTHGWIDAALNLQAWSIVIDAPLARDDMPRALVAALRAGRFHCVAALLGHDPAFSFTARSRAQVTASPGDSVSRDAVDELVVNGPSSGASPVTQVLLQNGKEVARSLDAPLRLEHPVPGSYRVEVQVEMPQLVFSSRTVPVIYSNRIRVTATP